MKFGALGVSLVTATLFCPAGVRADPPTRPVVISSVGPQRIRIRVAIGQSLPCSSSSNQVLFEGPMEPDQSVLIQSPELPVCVEHTHGAFPDTEWSPGQWWPPHCPGKGPCQLPPLVRVVVSSN